MRKLLIADDESGIRSLVGMTLQSDECQILEASTGMEALTLVTEHQPELVLLDIQMPGMDGFEVCRAIKDRPALAGTTVIMLTALAQESDLQRGREAGADGYFTKPFSPVELMQKVDEVFAGRAVS